ncbi:MAG: NUDIX hydrolase [Lysobacter sp.]|nr:NUDIX hydrolase [Lysobacter sp.]
MPPSASHDAAGDAPDAAADRRPPPAFDAGTLEAYALRWPDESAVAEAFAALLAEGAHAFHRERLDGHFTGSAWLVNAAGTHLLMTHHRKLDRWLQLGGHADGDRDMAAVALKEAEEESGLVDLVAEPELFDLDRHWIPERGDVPGHWHYDARYVVRTTGSEAFAVSDESHALAWREIAPMLDDPATEPSIRRMARKWVSRRV